MTTPTLRFAPSPNGYLHLGHALSALINADMARRSSGRLLLRIEDIDTLRCRPEFEAAIYDDLGWLGIAWETPVRRQSEHFAAYRAALARLDAMDLIYPAFESRSEIARIVATRDIDWPRDPDGAMIYPGSREALTSNERAAGMASGEPFVLRLDMRAAIARTGPLTWLEQGAGPNGQTSRIDARPQDWGDVILARKETPTSYHLSVVVDDALQGVTHVVRGQDLLWSTSVHRLLQTLLGLPQPLYHHHRLIRDAQGAKLSKSTHATALRAWRERGIQPAAIRAEVGLPPA